MFDNLPIFYAFSAGMVATINPCGFAMLPAYIAYHLGLGDESKSVLARSTYGTAMGLVATLGFVTLFGSVGLVISAGGRFIIEFFPYWGLGVGIILVLLGLFLLISRKHLSIIAASRFQGPRTIKGVKGFYLFGIGYGLASLSCTLPIFLVVVGSALGLGGIVPGLIQFVSYGLGMGAIIIGVTLSVVFFKTAVANGLRVIMPHVETIGAAALVLTGGYLVYYWTLGSGKELLFT